VKTVAVTPPDKRSSADRLQSALATMKWHDDGSHSEAGSGRQSDNQLETNRVVLQKGLQVFAIGKKVLGLLLLLCLAAAPLGCLSINKERDNEPTKEVNVGGEHGVTVEH